MKAINIAFEILSDPGKRQQYDETLVVERPRQSDRSDQNRDSDSAYIRNEWQVSITSDDLGSQTVSYDNDYDANSQNRLNTGYEAALLEKNDPSLESRYRIIVEPSLCLAFGSCETLAPKVFVVEKNRRINPKAVVISETAEAFETILDAAQTCPTKAIFIIDRHTGERIFP